MTPRPSVVLFFFVSPRGGITITLDTRERSKSQGHYVLYTREKSFSRPGTFFFLLPACVHRYWKSRADFDIIARCVDVEGIQLIFVTPRCIVLIYTCGGESRDDSTDRPNNDRRKGYALGGACINTYGCVHALCHSLYISLLSRV